MTGQGLYDRGIAPDGRRVEVGEFVRIADCDVWWLVVEVWPYDGKFMGLARCTTRWPMPIEAIVERGKNAWDLGREDAIRRRQETEG